MDESPPQPNEPAYKRMHDLAERLTQASEHYTCPNPACSTRNIDPRLAIALLTFSQCSLATIEELYEHLDRVLNMIRLQQTALVTERDALRAQVAALTAERDGLRDRLARFWREPTR